ncbi:MAG: FixH family protein [Acetobacteraceae bacterium]|nr:FixH family protein [Acetobacteraceae bacterium]
MRLHDGMGAARGDKTPRSAWRWFPWAIAGCMLVVMVVNFGMVYAALHTFPGQAGSDGFDLSNHYDTVIERVQQQAALGWTLEARADAEGRPVLALTDKTGAPLTGARVDGTAERPLGAERTTHVAFQEQAPGRYVGDAKLGLPGQWDLSLVADAGGHQVVTTRRIIVR